MGLIEPAHTGVAAFIGDHKSIDVQVPLARVSAEKEGAADVC